LNIQRSIFYCLALSLFVYGLNYHISKGLIQLTALLSVVNIALAIKNKSINNLSIDKPGVLPIVFLLLVSSAISAVYYILYDNPIAERLFSNTFPVTLAFSLIIPSLNVNKSDGNILLYSAIASCIFLGLSGIVDYALHGNSGYRTAGFINAPIIYAVSVSLITTWINVNFFSFLLKKNWMMSALCFLSLCIGFLSIFLSGSRGPILASTIIFFLLLIHFLILNHSNIKKTLLALVSISLFLSILLLVSNLSFFDNIKNRFESGITNISTGFHEGKRAPTSAGVRLDMWEASFVTICDYPLTGIGAGNHARYFQTLDQEQRINVNTDKLMRYNHMHNDIIQAWLSMGVIFGTLFLLYILYLTAFFFNQVNHQRSSRVGLLVCISFILCGLTDVPAHSAVSLTLFLLITSLNLSYINSSNKPKTIKK